MTATPPEQAGDKPFRWEGTMSEIDSEVRRRWIKSNEQAPQPAPEDIPPGIMPSGGELMARELVDAKRENGKPDGE